MSVRRIGLGGAVVGAAVGAFAACGGDDGFPASPDAGGRDATVDVVADGPPTGGDGATPSPDATSDAAAADASDAAPATRTATLDFDGEPNGLYWEYGTNAALYVADEKNNRIVRWTD